MQIGLIGLGKMGRGLSLNMLDHGHEVVVWNRSKDPVEKLVAAGAEEGKDIKDLVAKLEGEPKIVWLMMPAGEVTEQFLFSEIDGVVNYLNEGDVIIDGANSNYKDTKRRNKQIVAKGIRYVDIGVSGGPVGARKGACMMMGCDDATVVELLTPLLDDLNVEKGWGYFGKSGAGQFVKMVHNGIEYGMMQAIAEGFAIMKASEYEIDFDKLTDVYNHGSVIESRLIGWLQSGFREYGEELGEVSGTVGHLGEGKWTAEVAEELGVDAPIISGSFKFREDSKDNPSYTGQIVSVLRNQFGGHTVKKGKWKKSSL